VVEGARLESVYTATYRGFESLLLRQIDSSRSVTLSSDYTNTRELEHVRRQEALDSEVIDFIKDLISQKPMNQSAVITACKDAGMGNRKPTMRILRAYKNIH
jgi:hypothetical protein